MTAPTWTRDDGETALVDYTAPLPPPVTRPLPATQPPATPPVAEPEIGPFDVAVGFIAVAAILMFAAIVVFSALQPANFEQRALALLVSVLLSVLLFRGVTILAVRRGRGR